MTAERPAFGGPYKWSAVHALSQEVQMRRTAFAAVVVAAIVVLPASAPAATNVLRAAPTKVSFGTRPVG